MTSEGFSAPDLSAGPAGTKRKILVASSSLCSTAPMPSNDSDILMLKLVDERGEKYWVCGSKVAAKALIKVWNASSLRLRSAIFCWLRYRFANVSPISSRSLSLSFIRSTWDLRRRFQRSFWAVRSVGQGTLSRLMLITSSVLNSRRSRPESMACCMYLVRSISRCCKRLNMR